MKFLIFSVFLTVLVVLVSNYAVSTQILKPVTYPGIGTFAPFDFNRTLNPFVPQDPTEIAPNFLLYTKSNLNAEYLFNFNDSQSIQSSPFDGAKRTNVILHGWVENQAVDAKWMHILKDAILVNDDFNVIILDWYEGAKSIIYPQAAVNTRVIGIMLGLQIELLCKLKGTNPADFHIIGHSLGAHVSGYAGKHLNGTLDRITGLDPAGFEFEGLAPEARLWNTDAHFVDSIHTDARPIWDMLGYGSYDTCAHVDIYPNGGKFQPGCNLTERLGDPFKPDNSFHYLLACFHHRSVDFFIDSYNPFNPLPKAYQCDNYEDFLDGKCIDCGENGKKCVLLGPKAIEYTNRVPNFNQSVVNGKDGKRFFMISGPEKPFLNKYQYIIHLNFGSTLLQPDLLLQCKLNLSLVDQSGNSEEFDFNNQKPELKLSQTMIQTGMSSIDPAKLDKISIAFEWDFINLIDRTLHQLARVQLNSIEVIGLTASDSTIESEALKIKFCSTSSGNIAMGNRVLFQRC